MHALDANTVALYRLQQREPTADYAGIADAGGDAIDLACVGSNHNIGGGKGAHVSAHWFGATSYAHASLTPTQLASAMASFTLAVWVYLDPTATGASRPIFSVAGLYGAGSDIEVNNTIFEWTLSSGLQQQTFWETGAGANIATSQVAGSAVPTGEWVHLALRATFAGGTTAVDYFMNGVLQDSSAGTSATGGTASPEVRLGMENFGASTLNALMQSMLWQGEAVSDATILAWSALDEHTVDGSTLALWQCEESPDFVDLSGNGAHLKIASGTFQPAASPDLSADTMLHAAAFRADALKVTSGALLLTGEMTIEAFFRYLGDDVVFCVMAAGGETLATNYLFEAMIVGGALSSFFEYGAGTNVDATSAALVDPYSIRHLAFVRRYDGASWWMDFYVDGALFETVALASSSAGGTDCVFSVGGLSGGNGDFGDLRISSVARTAEEILASASDLGGGSPAPTPTPPTVTWVSPTGVLTAGMPIVVDATDADGFSALVLMAEFSNGAYEVVHDGVAFAQAYATRSTRTVIDGGFRYSVVRYGGWFGSRVVMRLTAVDSAGASG
jgi:Concanavalin A-like lectin/glucanases superfamily